MSVFKCKMCGGTISFNLGDTVGVCEYCGSKQTLPRLDNDKKASMYDRANHFRRTNDFDKATNIYEQILNEDKTDAEAYWSLVLCRYGIEYVEDPSTHKRVPTVNRVQFTSIFNDDDYKSALEYADEYQREIYKEEAKTIDDIQNGILAISSKEEPFDIFICYKETDSQGRRTIDSVLAYDIYNKLTKEGYKVFFSRVTLEDKLGTAYEPYIFAALNSAKIMIAIGTKPEYFNAVWVKNEWSRYLALIKNGADKTLIPAYRDMDPYDLPEEFSYLQALDMSKLGFMQDLIRGVGKIIAIKDNQVKEYKKSISTNTEIEPLLKRGFMFLEDGNWNSANEYFERVLDIDPENASAYLGKLLSKLKVTKQEQLKDLAEPFNKENDYLKVIRFGDEKLKEDLDSYINHINIRNKNARLEDAYVRAKIALSIADNEESFKESARLFESINEYKDSSILAKKCYVNAEIARKDVILFQGKQKMSSHIVSDYEEAIKIFKTIPGWKDADECIDVCEKEINKIKQKTKRNKKIIIIGIPVICVIIVLLTLLNNRVIPYFKYAYHRYLLKNASVGDYVIFGSYEQDNDLENGKEDIEWLVLDVIDDKALLISKYALGYGLNSNNSVREWLNGEFIDSAFTNDEIKMISNTSVSYYEDFRLATQDKVFSLSIDEANKYFNSDDERKCKATEYAVINGVFISKKNNNCIWRLRTITTSDAHITYVDSIGVVHEYGRRSGLDSLAVRPALWVKLNS